MIIYHIAQDTGETLEIPQSDLISFVHYILHKLVIKHLALYKVNARSVRSSDFQDFQGRAPATTILVLSENIH